MVSFVVVLITMIVVTTPFVPCCDSFTFQFLSELPTPSFLIDTNALYKFMGRFGLDETDTTSIRTTTLPTLYLPKYNISLDPKIPSNARVDNTVPMTSTGVPTRWNLPEIPTSPNQSAIVLVDTSSFPTKSGTSAIGYLHTKVLQTLYDWKDTDHWTHSTISASSPYLVELDVTPSLCCYDLQSISPSYNRNIHDTYQTTHSPSSSSSSSNDADPMVPPVARLVLGLNNHHVGSYYWARSTGFGSSMDAIGIHYGDIHENRGILRWKTDQGPTACNSNDGKRSEWVRFLREGDIVQLVPSDVQEALMAFLTTFGNGDHFKSEQGRIGEKSIDPQSIRVFGINSKGRPLGSEPVVVCEWICRQFLHPSHLESV